MTYGMTFRGELSFPSDSAIDEAFIEVDEEVVRESLVDRSAFARVAGPRLRLDLDCSGPASMWEPTVALLGIVASHASGGRVMCVFEGEDDEDEIETVSPFDGDDEPERGPFPAAFVGTLAFADEASLRGALEDQGELPLVVRPTSVRIEHRVALFRKAWAEHVLRLQTLASRATDGAIDTKIVHAYLPDGEVLRILAGAHRPEVVW